MTVTCLEETCNSNFDDFTFISPLSGPHSALFLKRGTDERIYCFKSVHDHVSSHLPERNIFLKGLRSPFLVGLHHCFLQEDRLDICMEYCAGGSLYDVIKVKKQKLSNTDIWLIITQLVHGLAFLHENGIIHRDVKPSNVFLCSEERPLRVKLGDFSICIDLNDSPVYDFCGTPLFMAPEVLQGGCYDTAVDMWSLGVLIYFLVHGSYPFESFLETLTAEIPTSDSEFSHLISRLLVRDPTERATAEELLRYPKIAETYDRHF
ncbi:hypothetical protein RCL1_001934 [Eukaryota sp. TZLM3-RCL]